AHAADAQGVRLGLGGYYKGAVGSIIEDDVNQLAAVGFAPNTRDTAVKQDVEVWFMGESTLDNGLTVGARVELEGIDQTASATGAGQIDEVFAYLRGSFGEIRIGNEDDVRRLKGVVAPQASKVFTSDDYNNTHLAFTNNPFSRGVGTLFTGSNFFANNGLAGQNSTLPNVENDGAKIVYLSPSFNGFSLGVSFAPTGNAIGNNNAGTTPVGVTTGLINSHAWSFAGNYDGRFDQVKVMASLGYTDSNREGSLTNNADDVSAWAAGLSFGFRNFALGGSYSKVSDAGGTGNTAALADGNDVTVWNIGGTYETGPYTVGVSFSEGEYSVTSATEPTLSTWVFSGSYALGPGITLDAAITHNDFDRDGTDTLAIDGLSTTADYQDTAIMVGSSIKF
ncbi:MAG: porin, partial [Dongiaceae bacterium]